MIDRQTIDKIMNAADIVDVVSEFVTLKKSGANYKGLCPFHNERTPSFMVSPSRGICHCFSCGKGGNPVGFIMEHEQMTYPEALKWLARRYHIEVKEKELTAEEKEQETKRESLFIVNEWAMQYFEKVLKEDVDGRAIGMQYFRSRGFSDDIIAKFHLGYALSGRDAMTKAAKAAGYNPDYLVTTGLSIRRDDGSMYDRYSDRVIFPWFNISGRICAFGGRLLSKETKGVSQKYVNSPDSDIYHKDHELYGLYQAKKQIVKDDRVFMVEGYTDVLSMHQCGIENVVANSGTALSMHQIRRLHRFTSNITLLYDGDAAGIHAALRGTDMLLSEGMNIKVLLFPDGDDPDSFARKHTAEEFRQYIADHQQDFIRFEASLLMGDAKDDPIRRSQAISQIVKSVSVIPDPITRTTYLQECSSILGIREETLITTMNKFIQKEKEEEWKRQQRAQEAAANGAAEGSPTGTDGAATASSSPVATQIPGMTVGVGASMSSSSLEQMLTQMVVRHGSDLEMTGITDVDGNVFDLTVAQYIYSDLSQNGIEFADPLCHQILVEAAEHCGDEGFNTLTYFNTHPDINIQRVATQMMMDNYQVSKLLQERTHLKVKEQVLRLLGEYKMYRLDDQIAVLKRQLSQVGNDMDAMKSVMTEIRQLQQQRNALAAEVGRTSVKRRH